MRYAWCKQSFLPLILLTAATAGAQQKYNPVTQIDWPKATGNGAPALSCTFLNYGQPYTDLTNNKQYNCSTSGWITSGGGGGGSVTIVSGATSGGFITSTINSTTTPVVSVAVDGSHVLPVNTGSASLYLNQAGGYSSPAGGGGCAIGVCIQNAGTSAQTITVSPNANLGITGTNWAGGVLGKNDLTSQFGTFTTLPADTGGNSVEGLGRGRAEQYAFNNPGWNDGATRGWGTSPWFTSVGHNLQVDMGAQGIGNTFMDALHKYGNGDANGPNHIIQVYGGYVALNDEGATGEQLFINEGSVGTGTVTSGGSTGATSIVVNLDQPMGVGRILVDATSSVGVISTTATSSGGLSLGGRNEVAISTLGTTLGSTSACGILAGGPIAPTTAYSITSNVITITGTNNLFSSELVTLTGYGTSTFLNGQLVQVISATSGSFTAALTHANASATEAGAFITQNVDVPRQPANGSVSTTFGITLAGAYTGSTTAQGATIGSGFYSPFRLSSVGAYTGGVQYVTANLTVPINAGSLVCLGGLAGDVIVNSPATNGLYYNYIIGNPTTTTIYVGTMIAGVADASSSPVGTVDIRPGAIIQSFSGSTANLYANSVGWANGDSIIMPTGIAASYVYSNKKVLNANPNAQFLGDVESYNGAPLTNSGYFKFSQGAADPTSLVAYGGIGHGIVGWRLKGYNATALFMDNPPTSMKILGNIFPDSVININCEAVAHCSSTYRIFTSSGDQTSDAHLEVTPGPSSNVFNFDDALHAIVLKVNGVPVGTGSVTNITTTGPITGGTITTTGAIACPSCVTGTVTNNSRILRGAGGQLTGDGCGSDDGTTFDTGNCTNTIFGKGLLSSGTPPTVGKFATYTNDTFTAATNADLATSSNIYLIAGSHVISGSTYYFAASPSSVIPATFTGSATNQQSVEYDPTTQLAKSVSPCTAGNWVFGRTDGSGNVLSQPHRCVTINSVVGTSPVNVSTTAGVATVSLAQTALNITAPLNCADTSGSGTAQVCTTSPTFTPAANSCILYTTTTANSGTGLTINVNSVGAKPVSKLLFTTTTLAAGDIPANVPDLLCYNGTSWNTYDVGNPSAGGTDNGAPSLSIGNFGALTANTYFNQVGGSGTAVTTEVQKQTYMPGPGTFSNLYVQAIGTTAAGTVQFILRKNGIDQALTCTVTASTTAGLGCSDTNPAHNVTVVAGDVVGWKIVVATATITNATIGYPSVLFK